MSPPDRAQTRPHNMLLGSSVAFFVAAWSFNFIFGKIALKHLAPLTLASFRVVLAGLIMLPVCVFWRLAETRKYTAVAALQNPLQGISSGTRRTRFGRRDFQTFALLGLLGVALNQICFTVGLSYTTVGHSSLIIGMGPIFILLLARAYGLEALTPRKVLGMAIAFAGVTVLAAEHSLSLRSATLRGDLITLLGSLAFALYVVLGKRVAAEYDTIAMNGFSYLAGAIMALPLALREALGLSGARAWGAVGWQGWAALAYMAVFGSVLAYLLYFWVLRYLPATQVGSFSYLLPVLSTLLGIVLLGEQLTPHLLLGGGLVLVGVYRIVSGGQENAAIPV